MVRAGAPLTTGRDVAALAITDALERPHLAHQIVNILDGERQVADALDAIEPLPLPPPGSPTRGVAVPLGVAQADNPPDDPKMIEPDAAPLDADVEWVGDGPVPPELSATTISRRGFPDGTAELPRAREGTLPARVPRRAAGLPSLSVHCLNPR